MKYTIVLCLLLIGLTSALSIEKNGFSLTKNEDSSRDQCSCCSVTITCSSCKNDLVEQGIFFDKIYAAKLDKSRKLIM